MAVPDFREIPFCIELLEDSVNGNFGNRALICYIIKGSDDNVIFIPRMQQPQQDIQRFGVRQF